VEEDSLEGEFPAEEKDTQVEAPQEQDPREEDGDLH